MRSRAAFCLSTILSENRGPLFGIMPSYPQQPCSVPPADQLALGLTDRDGIDEMCSFEAVFQRIVDREHDTLGAERRDGALQRFRLTGARCGGVDVSTHVVGRHP